ncbi:MAG: M48 family metalloprotease, partial [Myxococcota bacterium]
MSGIRLRAVGDKRLSEKLQAHPVVRSVVQGIEREAEKGTLGTRRRLLATSLRLTDGMAPTLAPMVRECQETLAMDGPVEIFVYPSASFNAAAVKPEHGRFILMFSSSLLECFDEGELRYVVGHELGHHL